MAFGTVSNFKSPQERTPDSEAYWQGLKEHQIRLQRCKDCGAWTHPPFPFCHSCLSRNREFVTLSGRGTVYSYTVTRRAMHPDFAGDVPYTIIYVKTEEGPFIVSWLEGVEPDNVRIGMPVVATFEEIDDETTLHRFRIAN